MDKIFYDRSVCLACKSCVFACAVEHSKSKSADIAILESPLPASRIQVQGAGDGYVPVACRQCDPSPCVEACISGAMRMVDGEVICEADKCIGCWMCVMVCPFGAVSPGKSIAVKCDFCPDREDSYACIEACPTRALFVSTRDAFEEFIRIRKEKKS